MLNRIVLCCISKYLVLLCDYHYDGSLMLSLCWKWNACCVLLLKGFLLFESLCYGKCLELRILTDCSCLQGLSIPLLAVLPFFPALPGRTLWVLLCITSVLRFILSVMRPSFKQNFQIPTQECRRICPEKFVATHVGSLLCREIYMNVCLLRISHFIQISLSVNFLFSISDKWIKSSWILTSTCIWNYRSQHSLGHSYLSIMQWYLSIHIHALFLFNICTLLKFVLALLSQDHISVIRRLERCRIFCQETF